MPYDAALYERVRDRVGSDPRYVEKQMFGGVSFLRDGMLCFGVYGDGLLVRVGVPAEEATLAEAHVRAAEMGGRPMHGWVMVEPAGIADDADLAAWIARAEAHAATLPPKR